MRAPLRAGQTGTQFLSILRVCSVVFGFALANAQGPGASAVPVAEKIADGFVSAEGPVWHPDGYLLFSDVHGARIIKVTPGGGDPEVWFDKGIKTNGLAFSADHRRLFACCYSERQLLEIDPVTREYKTLASAWNGREFNNVNDLVLDKQGNIFFTDPKWGPGPDDIQGIYCYSADGETTLAARVDRQPNGICVSPDGDWLFVSRSGARDILRFRLDPGGSLYEPSTWARVESEPDGITMDQEGRMYVALAGNGKLCVLSPEGRAVVTIPVFDRMATNCEFSGEDKSVLYVTGRLKEGDRPGAVYRVVIDRTDSTR